MWNTKNARRTRAVNNLRSKGKPRSEMTNRELSTDKWDFENRSLHAKFDPMVPRDVPNDIPSRGTC